MVNRRNWENSKQQRIPETKLVESFPRAAKSKQWRASDDPALRMSPTHICPAVWLVSCPELTDMVHLIMAGLVCGSREFNFLPQRDLSKVRLMACVGKTQCQTRNACPRQRHPLLSSAIRFSTSPLILIFDSPCFLQYLQTKG